VATIDVFALLDELRAIARNGLTFARDPYDRERYERLLEIATNSYEELLELPAGDVLERFRRDLGYVTNKLGADAAIFDERERVLLVRRSDDRCWGLVSGWVEPNESPAQTVVREIEEETGLHAVVGDLVGVFARPAGAAYGPHSAVAVVYLCSVTGGEPRPSHEVLDIRYWPLDEVDRWHKNHERYARAALASWQRRSRSLGS
jgi:ADP-ribose pyrophosphatase YjhB (NUDIX family)